MKNNRGFCCLILIAVVTALAARGPVAAQEIMEAETWVLDRQGQRPEPKVAIEGVCAWPNLTRLPDGTIVALIYNQPSHGQMPGDVECWASTDEGGTWTRRSVAAPRGTPEQNRMNVAAGLTADGSLILVASGWSHPGNPEADRPNLGQVLPAWVCLSADGGKTWRIDRESFPSDPEGHPLIPFGDIMPGQDGNPRVAAYTGVAAGSEFNYVVRGNRDGTTWEPPVRISGAPRRNETALLHLGNGKWLAAARRGSLEIFYSEDDALTWKERGRATRNLMIPGHLLRLADGTLVLSYGNRNRPRGVGGVEVKFSDDEGLTWSEPFRLLDVSNPAHGDLGYPSSVMRRDGLIVTAWYEGNPRAGRYHMGVVVWDPVRTRKKQ